MVIENATPATVVIEPRCSLAAAGSVGTHAEKARPSLREVVM